LTVKVAGDWEMKGRVGYVEAEGVVDGLRLVARKVVYSLRLKSYLKVRR
jgi:hypothetical protein